MSDLEKDLRGVDASEAQFLLVELRDQIAEVYWQLNDQDYSRQKMWMDHLCWSITQLMDDEPNGWEETPEFKDLHIKLEGIAQFWKEPSHEDYHNLEKDLPL